MIQQKIAVEYSLQGHRDYVDISQTAYKAFSALGVDVNKDDIVNLKFQIFKPITQFVEVVQLDSSRNYKKDFDLIAEFSFQTKGNPYHYGLYSRSEALPQVSQIPEPECQVDVHYKAEQDRFIWLKDLKNTDWPVFFAFMTLGRELSKAKFKSPKPKALDSSMARVPKPSEVNQLWVDLKRGPIQSIIVINLHCGKELIGTTKIKL